MPQHWFIKTKSGKKGPVTSKMLVRLADKGRLKPNSGVSPDGESWIKAKHVVGLSFADHEQKRWYLKTKMGDAGPFTIAKLNKLVQNGRVRPDYAVSCDGKQWIQAKQVPGLHFPKPIEPPSRQTVDDAADTTADDAALETHEQTELREATGAATSDTQGEFTGRQSADDAAGSGQELLAQEDEAMEDAPLLVAPSLPHTSHELKAKWSELREAEYLRRFGPITEVSRSNDTSEGAIDVYVHAPHQRRPITTLVTSGMSDIAMDVPHGSCSPRAEMVLYVAQMHPDYIKLLRALAGLPHAQRMRLSYGSLMDNGSPPRPIFSGSVLDGYVFMIPNIDSDFRIQDSLRIDDDPLQLLWVVPTTQMERDFISQQGMQSFCALLDRNHHALVLDPLRRCYVNPAGVLAAT